MSASITFKHPWQSGPSELIRYALEHIHKEADFDQRIAFLLLDIGVETTCKTFLELSEEVTHTSVTFGKRQAAADGNFHELMTGIKEAAGQRLTGINVAHIEDYHRIRNQIYHRGNGITVATEKATAYAEIAVDLLDRLLGVDLREYLLSPEERHPKYNELMSQLEIVASHIKDELEIFWRSLSLLLDDIEPMLSRPKFSKALVDWSKTLYRLYLLSDNITDTAANHNQWVEITLSSMPLLVKEFADKYLSSTVHKVMVPHVEYRSDLYGFARKVADEAGLYANEPEGALETLREYTSLIVAEQKFDKLSDIREDLDRTHLFLYPPPDYAESYEEAESSLTEWLADRRDSLTRIQSINKTISALIETLENEV